MKTRLSKRLAGVLASALCAVMLLGTAASYAAETISSDTSQSGQTYSSTTASENALLVSGGTVTLSNITVTKSGDSSGGDSDNFYGTNSAVLAKGGAKLTISGSKITSTANGANGVFSYGGNGGSNGAAGDGTTVTISDSTITTSGNNAGGIMTTGGGVMNASNLTINTSGNSSAAIRTDRGGGTVSVNGGSYTSTGVGSPAIYSTAEISVTGAALKTTKSEAVVIEGKNSVTLENCTVEGNNSQKNGQSTTYENVKIYQSMSGDAASGTAVFTMNGGSMSCATGSMFHVTNTSAIINLNGAQLTNSSDGSLLAAGADAWGTSGKNGGNVTLNASNQTLNGAITVDSISTLNLKMSSGSIFTGSINSSGQSGSVYAEIPSGCTWKLDADSYVTSLSCDASSIDLNGHTLYVNGQAYTAGSASSGEEVSGGSDSAGGDAGGQQPPQQDGQQPPQQQDGQNPPSQDGQQPPQQNGQNSPSQDGQNPPENAGSTEQNDAPAVSNIAGTVIKKLTKAKKAFTVKWKKVKTVDGYQIQYSTSSDFSGGTKTVTVKKNSTTSKKIKKLKSKKTYYVRIRTYKTVNGTMQLSQWSAAKKIKTR